MTAAARAARPPGAPLALQVTALLVGSLVVAQAVTLGLTLLLPPAPAPQHALSEVAAALRGAALRTGGPRPLQRAVRDQPPSLQSVGWTSSERSRAELAALVGAPEADVRLLFYSPPPFAGALLRTAAARPRVYAASLAGLLAWEGGPRGGGGGAADGGFPGGGGGTGAAGRRGAGLDRTDPEGARTGAPGPAARPSGVGPGGGAFRGGPAGDAGVISHYPAHGTAPGVAPQAGRVASGAEAGPTTGVAAGAAASGPFSERAAAAALAATTPVRAAGLVAPAAAPVSTRVVTAHGGGGGIAVPVLAAASGLAVGALAAHELDQHAAPPARAAGVAAAPRPQVVPPTAPRTQADVRPVATPLLDGAVPVSPALAARLSPTQALAVVRTQADRAAADRGGYLLPSAPAAAGRLGALPASFVGGDFVAALRIAPGRWVTVQPRPEGFPSAWQQRLLLWFALSFAVVTPLGLLFARRLAAPLGEFAMAAERLGKDPSGAHLALGGPAEVGRAAQAFNRMQGRLKRYIDDRTAMVGAISHDLRTPLARMRFRLERAPTAVRAPVLADIAQMEEMISSVLVFIRDASEPAVRERVDLRSILECVVDGAAETGAQAELDPGEPVPVDVDSLSVQRVVSNLVENALKYGEYAHVRMYADGAEAVAEVEDDGPGLPDEEMERVFLPFYRSERARTLDTRGIGLGLAVSRSIARAHGGDVRLLSRGRGLVAQLRLPLAERAA